ncbi:hypothetical protein L0156_19880 [bacterium]|nr:hypothetical protein [bacterium]
MLHSIVFHTLGQLATGILLLIGFVPPSKIGSGFGRFHTILAWALWVLAFWGNFPVEFYILTASILLAFLFSQKDSLYYPFLALCVFLSFFLLLKGNPMSSVLWQLPAALVLGSSSVAMLLGHWYLVAPKLPITYLKILTIALIAAILIRSAFLAEAFFTNQTHLKSIHFYELYGIFFLQRIALGLFLTLALSILTYYCVRIRSTQSATGILYVVLVFCLVGEITGAYLFLKTGLSL